MSEDFAPTPAVESVPVAPTPSAEPAAEPQIPDGQTTPEVSPEQKPERSFSQKELDEIIAKRLSKAERSWERRNREILETALTAGRSQPVPQPTSGSSEPDPTKFTDYAEYMRAVTRYEADEAIERRITREQEGRQQRTQADRQVELQKSFQQHLAKGSEKYDDFEEVALDPSVPINQYMAEVITESEIGADVAYYLAKNRAEAQRISTLSPLAAAREIGRIEAKLLTAPTEPKVSSAPSPIIPVAGKAGVSKDPTEMTQKEFDSWRKKQIAARH